MLAHLLRPLPPNDRKLLKQQAWTIVALGVLVNVLVLVQPVFMLHVYDFVLPSQSRMTLLLLAIIALFVVCAATVVDYLRMRLFVDVAAALDGQIRARAIRGAYLRSVNGGASEAAVATELDSLRSFISGPSPSGLLDLPWTPLYILALFLLSPWLGLLALASTAGVLGLAYANEQALKRRLGPAHNAAQISSRLAEDALGAPATTRAMGFSTSLLERWVVVSRFAVRLNDAAAIDNAGFAAGVRGLRQALQILSLAVAAYLVLEQQLSAGSIIAASLIGARALAPMEGAITNWKRFVAARLSLDQVAEAVAVADAAEAPRTSHPRPKGAVSCEGLSVVGAEAARILKDVSFEVPAGSFVGVIGRSGSGKSTLLRTMAGAVRPAFGKVRLDGADLAHWAEEDLGAHVGYMPQETTLHYGSVAENIRRFGPQDDRGVMDAAVAAGAHAMIQALPEGYDTDVGGGEAVLSGGEQQRISLARALFGAPSLIFLDEPSSHLDGDAEDQMIRAVHQLHARGSTVFMVTHKPSHLRAANFVMLMDRGQVVRFGPAAEVLGALAAPLAKAS